MRSYKKLKEYSVFEINDIVASLRQKYDIVRLVDVEECRIIEVKPDGDLAYHESCFCIWNRKNRCANCSSLRACMTHAATDKTEHLGRARESIHSVPIYLELKNGQMQMCVIECVSYAGDEDETYVETAPAEYVNTHDVLTRLYTREKLFREIRQRLNDNPEEQYLLVMSNIHNFSVVNKLYGIEYGNRLLIRIADTLRQECTREEIYGRYQDDRFLLLIRKDRFHQKAFLEKLQKIKSLIDSPIFSIQTKLGVYEITARNLPVSAMIECANIAVNSIRDSQSREIAHYAPDMMARKVREQNIVAEFEHALGSGEFQIFLQPQVHYNGEVLGSEALVRWIHPNGEIVPPNDFLPVLRDSELLANLDVYVWEKAVQQLNSWKVSEFAELYISINIDPTDFYYMDVPAVLSALCEKYAVPPAMLHVEITESALFDNIEQQNHIVDKLHNAGFIVEIDDFGKGFSSLSLLKDLHADVLKIDMGFVQGEENQQRGKIILSSVIEMACNLKMGVITEGVENREQVDRLNNIGCRCFQGYYYSRPIPVRDFETAVRENSTYREPVEA